MHFCLHRAIMERLDRHHDDFRAFDSFFDVSIFELLGIIVGLSHLLQLEYNWWVFISLRLKMEPSKKKNLLLVIRSRCVTNLSWSNSLPVVQNLHSQMGLVQTMDTILRWHKSLFISVMSSSISNNRALWVQSSLD